MMEPQNSLHFTSAKKQIMGRPYGGNCFIINETAAGKSTIIREDSNRLAIKATNNNKSYVIIGKYLTCYHDNSSVETYEYQLSTILVIGDFQTFLEKIYDHHVGNNNKRNPLSK